jgi:hypothetical protein
MSCLLGGNRDIFFPKMSDALRLTKFSDIARRYVSQFGYEPFECASEDEARARAAELIAARKWPCYFFNSDTTGEKDFEEFFTDTEDLDMQRFQSIGVIQNEARFDPVVLDRFLHEIGGMLQDGRWERSQLVNLFNHMIPEFNHKETGKYLDGRM